MSKQTYVWIAALFVLLVTGFVVFKYTAVGPPTRQSALDQQEHAAVYASDENGYRLYEAAAAAIIAPDKVLRKELGALTVSGKASDAVREHLKRNAEALATFRKGLEKELCIARPYDDSQERHDMLGELRELAQTLLYEGSVHGTNGDFSKMLASYLDAYTLGYTMMKGGVLADSQIGIGIQHLAFLAIQAVIDKLDEADLQHLASFLEMSEERRVPFPEVLANEQSVIRVGFVRRILIRRYVRPALDRFEGSLLMSDVLVRGVALRARVRLYELEQGQLSDVMGGRPVPIDPFSGQPFAFLDGTIYSFGYDRDDDRGEVEAGRFVEADGDRLF